MKIQHENFDTKGRFYIKSKGKVLAEMTYSNAGSDKFIIDHTDVDESFKGQGVGYKLVAKAVAYAREKNLKIIPLCPFANAVFKKTAEFQDVL